MTSIADNIKKRAREMGATDGRATGSWVIDGNTSPETARAILIGWEDCDPRVMDMQPSPLSGEWADEMSPAKLMLALGLDPSAVYEDIHEDDVCAAYEEAFGDAFWLEVRTSAEAIA